MTPHDDATMAALQGLTLEHEQLTVTLHALQARRDGHPWGARGREISLAITRLEEARMWLHQAIFWTQVQRATDRRAADAP